MIYSDQDKYSCGDIFTAIFFVEHSFKYSGDYCQHYILYCFNATHLQYLSVETILSVFYLLLSYQLELEGLTI